MLLLLFVGSNSAAVSLGKQSGETIIGRPLDLAIQATIDPRQDVSNLCIDSDVFYADNKLSKSRVRITTEKNSISSENLTIRIRSTVPVDEPVVTFVLRLGCSQKTERRYVVLADLAVEATAGKAAQTAVQPTLPIAPNEPGPAKVGVGASRVPTDQTVRKARLNSDAATSRRGDGKSNVGTQSDSTPDMQTTRQKAVSPQRPTAEKLSEKTRARLKLEPLDLTIERDPQLKSSTQMLSVPAANLLERSTAAALWKALNAQPEDILREAEKVQALESSVRSLQDQNKKSELSITGLNTNLTQAQEERYSNPLVYLLAFLLLAAIAAMAFLLRRQLVKDPKEDDKRRWWRKNEEGLKHNKQWSDSFLTGEGHSPESDSALSPSLRPYLSTRAGVDIDLGVRPRGYTESKLKSQTNQDSGFLISGQSMHRAEYSLNMPNFSRVVNAKELVDFQQQIDFFLSIGQIDEAIDVLKSHIADTPATSVVAYLELFGLYYQTGRTEGFEALRDVFYKRFNSQMPEFERFNEAGAGLDAHPVELAVIESAWPSGKTLEIIGELMSKRHEFTEEAFSLEAYRDLALLHAVAADILNSGFSGSAEINQPRVVNNQGIAANLSDLDTSQVSFTSSTETATTTQVAPFLKLAENADLSAASQAFLPTVLDLDLNDLTAGTRALPTGGPIKQPTFPGTGQQFPDAPSLAAEQAYTATVKSQPSDDNLIDFDIFDLPQDRSGGVDQPKTR